MDSRPTRRRVLAAAPPTVVALLAGCTAPTDDVDTYRGRYSWGFEHSVFAPCGRAERWWVVDDADLVAAYRQLTDGPYQEVYAEVRGEVSEPGSYGQGGQYPRQLRVVDVVTVRLPEPDDCDPGADPTHDA